MSFWRRKRTPPPRPEPHPLLGEAYLYDDYNKLPKGPDWGCYQVIWADKADDYAGIIERTLADNAKQRAARKKARDSRAQIQEWHDTIAERINGESESIMDMIRFDTLNRVLEILDRSAR